MRTLRRYRRRRAHGNRRALSRIWRRRRFHPRSRIRRKWGHKTFHLRFHRTVTVDFKQATPSDEGQANTTLGWNLDHQYFTLEEFIKESKRADPMPLYTSTHWPPFRYYRIKKIVVKGRWINKPLTEIENVYGFTALDLDGEDEGRGDTSRSTLDPKTTEPNEGPLTYDPLMNRSSRKAFNARSGFKRIFRPKPQLLATLREGHGMFSYIFKSNPWVSTAMGSGVHWQGLSISMRQAILNTPIQMQYDIDAYIEFKEFDYETGTQKLFFK